jgi:hypothetical protein
MGIQKGADMPGKGFRGAEGGGWDLREADGGEECTEAARGGEKAHDSWSCAGGLVPRRRSETVPKAF